ncbi:MAG: Flp pilus assembly protein CpaB [Proteobacteria bacterium]|nr:Flp pilus assembly protein CpaB [Pseudomonadota bacterium]
MSLRILVVAMFLLTATGLGLIAYQAAMPDRPARLAEQAPAPAPEAHYLTAARNLPAGTLARDADFAAHGAAAGTAPPDAIPDTPEARAGIRGALIRRYLEAGAPVLQDDVLRPRDRGFLAAVLAPGMRAIAVGVDAVTGVAGLIWPGDRVDVILTQEMDRENAGPAHRVVSETVLSDIRVIAVDQDIVQGAAPDAGAAGKVARTVTLEVSPGQAEKATVAQRLGQLSLAIVPLSAGPARTGIATVSGADVSPALSRAEQPAGTRVQVIEGGKRNEVTFR